MNKLNMLIILLIILIIGLMAVIFFIKEEGANSPREEEKIEEIKADVNSGEFEDYSFNYTFEELRNKKD